MTVALESKASTDWIRKYPPLVSVLVALLLAIAVLPSALNLPQTNPTQTLEYAPVPPSDDEPPPPSGNLSSLGLGSSSGISEEGLGGTTGTLPLPGKGVNPSTKRCVGNPPRQTEDPISPPCVAYFAGDNFGNTYQGVTRDEIRLLVFIDSGIAETGGSKGSEVRPVERYFDLFEPSSEKDNEHIAVKGMRAWQRYFNDRFQTYGRAVHFFVYFSASDKSPEGRRADAADNFDKVRPFAVLTQANENEVDYVEAMAKSGVLNFGSFAGKQRKFFARYPKLIWGYSPTLEQQLAQYLTYVCTKVVPHPVALSGNPGENGRPRKLGMYSTTDENFPGLLYLAEQTKRGVEECGGKIEAEANWPRCCFAQDNGARPDAAAASAADFRQKGITTIIWPGGIEGYFPKATAGQGYFPEWIILGDGTTDGNAFPFYSGTHDAFDEKALVVTPELLRPSLKQQRCYQAYREADQQMAITDVRFVCDDYYNLFQFFTGIQVAGPRLGPTSIDKGFHAIPAVASKDPAVPACFYEVGDYTCVKDAAVEVWDREGKQAEENAGTGCWRTIGRGRRSLPGQWPAGNINAQYTTGEQCNGYGGGVLIDPNP